MFEQLCDVELNYLVNSFKLQLYLPDNYIVRQGEDATALFFINKGSVEVFIHRYDFISELREKRKQEPSEKLGEQSAAISSSRRGKSVKEEESVGFKARQEGDEAFSVRGEETVSEKSRRSNSSKKKRLRQDAMQKSK